MDPNPRRAKRIINVYRIVRQMIQPAQIAPEKLIKWIVLSERWPCRIAWTVECLQQAAQQPARHRWLPDDLLDDRFVDEMLPEMHQGMSAQEALIHTRANGSPNLSVRVVNHSSAAAMSDMDGDPDLFMPCVTSVPVLSIGDIALLRTLTFNLNPAIQEEVRKSSARAGGSIEAKIVTDASSRSTFLVGYDFARRILRYVLQLRCGVASALLRMLS